MESVGENAPEATFEVEVRLWPGRQGIQDTDKPMARPAITEMAEITILFMGTERNAFRFLL